MDEGHVLSTDVRLAPIFYAPTSKNLKGHFERAYCVCFVRYFICIFQSGLNHCFGNRIFGKEFDINMSIYMYYLLPYTKQIKYDSSISEIIFLSLLNHTCTVLETC